MWHDFSGNSITMVQTFRKTSSSAAKVAAREAEKAREVAVHHTEKTHLVGPLTYMGHLGIFKTVKNSLTWATQLDGPLT